MSLLFFYFFFFNDTATTEIYTLSLHDALPIWIIGILLSMIFWSSWAGPGYWTYRPSRRFRSEEHTSELQSQSNLVCRLLLEKKKKQNKIIINTRIKPHTNMMTAHLMIYVTRSI